MCNFYMYMTFSGLLFTIIADVFKSDTFGVIGIGWIIIFGVLWMYHTEKELKN